MKVIPTDVKFEIRGKLVGISEPLKQAIKERRCRDRRKRGSRALDVRQ